MSRVVAYLGQAFPNTSGIRESADGNAFFCPHCGALIFYTDLARVIAHTEPHATRIEAERSLQRD